VPKFETGVRSTAERLQKCPGPFFDGAEMAPTRNSAPCHLDPQGPPPRGAPHTHADVQDRRMMMMMLMMMMLS